MHKLQVTVVKRKSQPAYAYTRHDYREEDDHGIRHIVRIVPILQVNTGNAANRSSDANITSKCNANSLLPPQTTEKMEQSDPDPLSDAAQAPKFQQTVKSLLAELPPNSRVAIPTRPTSSSQLVAFVLPKDSVPTAKSTMLHPAPKPINHSIFTMPRPFKNSTFDSTEPLDSTSDEEEIEEDLQEHQTDSDSDHENEAMQEMALYDIMEEPENVSSSTSVSERRSSHSASRHLSLRAPRSDDKMASLESHHSDGKMSSLQSHHSADGVLSLRSHHSGDRETSLKSDGRMQSQNSHHSESSANSLKSNACGPRMLSFHAFADSFNFEGIWEEVPSDHSDIRVAPFKSEASGDGVPSDHSDIRVATFKSDGSQDDVMSLGSHRSDDKIPSLKSDHSDDRIPSLKSDYGHDKLTSLQSDHSDSMATSPKSRHRDSRMTSLEAPHSANKMVTSLGSHHSDDGMTSLKAEQIHGKVASLNSLHSDAKETSLNSLHSDGKETSLKSDRGQAKMALKSNDSNSKEASLKSDHSNSKDASLKSDHSNSKDASLKSNDSNSKEASLKSDLSQAKMTSLKSSKKSSKVDHSSMSDNEEGDLNSKLPVSSETSLSHVKLDILQREPNSGGGGSAEQSQSYNTDYMTFQSDLGAATLDIYAELSKRDDLIMKLTQSLQQSLNDREDQQEICDKLTDEINELRQQLRNALPVPRTSPKRSVADESGGEKAASDAPTLLPTGNISGRIEQFQKGLMPHELPNFAALQGKLQQFMADELQASTAAHSAAIEELRRANTQKDGKIKQLEESMREKLALHTKEMEELRKYFENKCVDLEKQFSDDVFSQKSQHHGSDTSSDFSDQEQKPSNEVAASKTLSPRKVAKSVAASGSSPAKPSTGAVAKEELTAKVSIEDLKTIYEKRRDDLQQIQDENLSKFSFNYNDNYFVDTDFKKHEAKKPIRSPLTDKQSETNRSGLILIDYDELNVENESRVIQAIVEEYEKRLQQQLVLAREDIVRELECQIQSLLSSESSDDHHWPPELILLREKLTAKSQIEIAQLQIKHEDEMSRLRSEYEKKLNRKRRRNLTFDSQRDVEGGGEGGGKRDEGGSALRQILHSYHSIVTDLSKCVLHCEAGGAADCSTASYLPPDDDKSLLERSSLNASRQVSLIPDVHSLLETVEDPQLLRFITGAGGQPQEDSFDLADCLERLKREAAYLLQLSQGYAETKRVTAPSGAEGNASHKSSEEGDCDPSKLCSRSLPVVWPTEANPAAQLQDVKKLLIKSEAGRLRAQQDCDSAKERCDSLQKDVTRLRAKLDQLQAMERANVSHGEQYIESSCSVEGEEDAASCCPPVDTFGKLQATARNVLSSPMDYSDGNTTLMLLQMIEDFCREGDKVIETFKGQHEDLRSQIGGADKQLKATRQFLEEQAAEREQERDEYLGEINRLEGLLRDKEKEKSSFESATRGMEQIQHQTSELMQKLQESNSVRDKFELELKASIDKIFVLREIITDLETQIETKSLNERALEEKVAHFEENIREHEYANESLQTEVQSLREDISHKYEKHIGELEEKLRNIRPAAEQLSLLEQLHDQLTTIESSLDQKTKVLELLQHSNTSNSCSEDISGQAALSEERRKKSVYFEENPSPRQLSATHEMVERIVEKLGKHSRIEEGVRKRVQDMDMQMAQLRGAMLELQQERDSLQERILEQTQRISGMQLRLDEQRQRNEEIQRAGTSSLNIRIHDLQTEVQNLNETLEMRDKQIAAMKRQLDMSKVAIDRLEAELAIEHQPDVEVIGRLEGELKQKNSEIQLLKERIKTEMINKLALPDLMETMLADKNEEIDYLKEQLESKEKKNASAVSPSCASASQSGAFMQLSAGDMSKYSGPRVATIVEFDEPDVVRREVPPNQSASLLLPDSKSDLFNSEIDSLHGLHADATHKYAANCKTLEKASTFKNPHYFQDKNFGACADNRSLVPRQIDFSALVEDSRTRPLRLFSSESEVERQTAEVAMQTTLENSLSKPGDGKISESSMQQKVDSLQESLEKLKEEKNAEIASLKQEKEALVREQHETKQKLAKSEADFRESEQQYLQRIAELERQVSESLDNEVAKRDDLRKELQSLSEIHGVVLRESEASRLEADSLRKELKAKQENILHLTGQIQASEQLAENLQALVERLQGEMEAMRQQGSENNSKQISVDEIAKEVEKELNYSAQLDSNILRAIESEEDNNLCQQHFVDKMSQLNNNNRLAVEEEHLLAERGLLNELEALRTQVQLGREQTEEFRRELIAEKQHSQEIQEQDMIVIEAMRTRLETAVEKQENLHKLLDIERSRCDRLQTQLATLQRHEARRKSLMLLKSPAPVSPPKSLRSLSEYDSKLGDRLRDSLRSLMAQLVGEPELGSTGDLRWCAERQQERHEEVHFYAERILQEIDELAQFHDSVKQEMSHLNDLLKLKDEEIESYAMRLRAVQQVHNAGSPLKTEPDVDYKPLNVDARDSLANSLSAFAFEGLDEAAARTSVDPVNSTSAPNANALHPFTVVTSSSSSTVPQQFLKKILEINELLSENTQENCQMAGTVKFLVEDRRKLQKKCSDLKAQLASCVTEMEDRCNHLVGRYLRVESHRKSLVYQKRYLKICLESYQKSEERVMANMRLAPKMPSGNRFRTVALCIIAIQRMKFIGRIWRSGKHSGSKAAFALSHNKGFKPPHAVAVQAKLKHSSHRAHDSAMPPADSQSPAGR